MDISLFNYARQCHTYSTENYTLTLKLKIIPSYKSKQSMKWISHNFLTESGEHQFNSDMVKGRSRKKGGLEKVKYPKRVSAWRGSFRRNLRGCESFKRETLSWQEDKTWCGVYILYYECIYSNIHIYHGQFNKGTKQQNNKILITRKKEKYVMSNPQELGF